MEDNMTTKVVAGSLLIIISLFAGRVSSASDKSTDKEDKTYEMLRDIDKNVALTAKDVEYIKKDMTEQKRINEEFRRHIITSNADKPTEK